MNDDSKTIEKDKTSCAKKRKRLSSKVLSWFFILLIVFGIAGLSYPLLSDLIEQWKIDKTISSMSSSYTDKQNPKRLECLKQANLYNENLNGTKHHTGVWPYEEQLTYTGGQIMGWIEIPKISIKMPVYHDTSNEVLMAGAGHLKNTSLPVGGSSTHCAVAAHTGMRNMRAFDDLHKLQDGDKFVFWTLGDAYCYEVSRIEVVEPNDVSSLQIKDGQDLATLITCTPYGQNTHRLLVHGTRCEYVPDAGQVGIDAYINMRSVPFMIAVAVLLGIIAFFVARKVRR